MQPEARILVTGATGFAGSWLVRELQRRGSDVVWRGLGKDDLDVVDPEAVTGLVQDMKPTAVIHLAAVAAPDDARRAPRSAWDVNVIGTFNLARAVLEHAPDARFIQIGSSDAYGSSFLGCEAPLSETALLDPVSVYGATKAAADLMIGQMARNGLNAIRFRPFNHTGPGQLEPYVVPSFARQVAEIVAGRRPPVIEVGNLSAERDFCDVRDVVRAYADAALTDRDIPAGTAINLATGRPRKIKEVLELLVEICPLEIEVRVDPERLRDNELPKVSGNADAAARYLGWRPEIPFEQTLNDVSAYWAERVAEGNHADERRRLDSGA